MEWRKGADGRMERRGMALGRERQSEKTTGKKHRFTSSIAGHYAEKLA
jgi:hypothetical protein